MTQQRKTFNENRVLLKGLLIGFITLVMLIPKFLVEGLIKERRGYQTEVTNEVSKKWAGAQTVLGPVLIVPYKKTVKKTTTFHKAYILPEQLKINGNAFAEEKKRSIYKVSTYKSKLSLTGKFSKNAVSQLSLNNATILWDDVKLAVSISDSRGLTQNVKLNWNNALAEMTHQSSKPTLLDVALASSVNIKRDEVNTFQIDLNLRGTDQLSFVPIGNLTSVNISSNWSDPSFNGYYLPDTSNVTTKGLNAEWNILQASRNYPQFWVDNNKSVNEQIDKSEFGVSFLQPADHYTKTDRTIKYALLIIILTFTVFFFIEILQKVQIHPLQYILVGAALIIFYTLLLSISEYTGFNRAYFIATGATVSLIGMYVWSIVGKGKIAISFSAALSLLYIYLFLLIQLKEYALLSGSIGLFIVLAIVMFFSRKIDWYHTKNELNETE